MVAITWTDKAKDLNNLVDYWSTVSENSAKLQVQRIFDKVQLLIIFLELAGLFPK